ncbi:hypothetical protein CRENBAI_005145 [Crenichthys baileyi]|uniref:Uncharacterized protein n=1 Tax=Crenichthys baileyi TaxID=28760 RepID=A0AAV9SCN0_9TELE
MQRIVTQLVAGKLQTYMAIVVIFTYGILLRRDFECTCKPQHYDCIIYAVLPALIVIVLMLWSNRLFHRFCSYCYPGSRTDEEREIIAEMKNTSKVIGCWLLFIIIFSGAMMSWIRWKCDGRCNCRIQTVQYEETLYYKLVLEEEERVLKEILRESINIKLTAEIKKKYENNWKECFNVANELLKNELSQTDSNLQGRR